jgi:hypothetical protein
MSKPRKGWERGEEQYYEEKSAKNIPKSTKKHPKNRN